MERLGVEFTEKSLPKLQRMVRWTGNPAGTPTGKDFYGNAEVKEMLVALQRSECPVIDAIEVEEVKNIKRAKSKLEVELYDKALAHHQRGQEESRRLAHQSAWAMGLGAVVFWILPSPVSWLGAVLLLVAIYSAAKAVGEALQAPAPKVEEPMLFDWKYTPYDEYRDLIPERVRHRANSIRERTQQLSTTLGIHSFEPVRDEVALVDPFLVIRSKSGRFEVVVDQWDEEDFGPELRELDPMKGTR